MGIEYSMVKYIYKLKTLYLSNEFSTSSLLNPQKKSLATRGRRPGSPVVDRSCPRSSSRSEGPGNGQVFTKKDGDYNSNKKRDFTDFSSKHVNL